LLVMRELDDALGLSDLASEALSDNRTGKNTVHRLDGLFRLTARKNEEEDRGAITPVLL